MYKKKAALVVFLAVLVAGFSLVSAFSLSSWFKGLFTGNVVEGDSKPAATAGVPCGSYELETPKDAVASSHFNNYRAANAIDNNVETHWFGDPALKYPKTIDLDLGGKRCINGVEVNVFLWDIPLKLKVEVSDDGHEWRQVSDEVVLDEGAKFERIDFPETTGRYVRLHEIAGKRPYGALSEIRVSAARQEVGGAPKEAKLSVSNVIAGPGLEKYYEIEGKRVYLEIDGTSVEEYFK
jgi:hypothetical protein